MTLDPKQALPFSSDQMRNLRAFQEIETKRNHEIAMLCPLQRVYKGRCFQHISSLFGNRESQILLSMVCRQHLTPKAFSTHVFKKVDVWQHGHIYHH